MSALNQMDALVFSSRVDNYPLILCEALSIGVPVIATHRDAAQEVLQSGGKTVSEEEGAATGAVKQTGNRAGDDQYHAGWFKPTQPRHLQWATN